MCSSVVVDQWNAHLTHTCSVFVTLHHISVTLPHHSNTTTTTTTGVRVWCSVFSSGGLVLHGDCSEVGDDGFV